MKLTSTILSVIFLLLSCMPCADIEADGSAHSKSELVSADNHSHTAGSDLCSPFCICSCCGSQMTDYSHFSVIDFPIVFKVIKKQLPTYKSILTSNFYGSIWQPPQIV